MFDKHACASWCLLNLQVCWQPPVWASSGCNSLRVYGWIWFSRLDAYRMCHVLFMALKITFLKDFNPMTPVLLLVGAKQTPFCQESNMRATDVFSLCSIPHTLHPTKKQLELCFNKMSSWSHAPYDTTGNSADSYYAEESEVCRILLAEPLQLLPVLWPFWKKIKHYPLMKNAEQTVEAWSNALANTLPAFHAFPILWCKAAAVWNVWFTATLCKQR